MRLASETQQHRDHPRRLESARCDSHLAAGLPRLKSLVFARTADRPCVCTLSPECHGRSLTHRQSFVANDHPSLINPLVSSCMERTMPRRGRSSSLAEYHLSRAERSTAISGTANRASTTASTPTLNHTPKRAENAASIRSHATMPSSSDLASSPSPRRSTTRPTRKVSCPSRS